MRKLAVTLAVVLGACGDATIGSSNPDAPLAIVVDARAFPDIFIPCDVSGAPDCPDGTRCLNGTCQIDSCIAIGTDGGSVCAEGLGCSVACVPLVDKCNGVACEAQQTCVNGRCVAGCYPPSKCLNVICPEGQFCSNGTCGDITPCEGTCPAGTTCNIFCRPLGPCEGIQCDEGKFCTIVGGEPTCVSDLCFNKTCAATFTCSNGECVPTCDCDPPCVPPQTCVNNQCVCKSDCTDKACGADDGCGHACVVQTCPTGETCNSAGMCVCQPSCPVGALCGDPNGCEGKCQGSCADDDTTCQNGTCTCPPGKTCATDCCGSDEVCNTTANPDVCCNIAQACAGQPCGTVVCGGAYTCQTGSCPSSDQTCQQGVCKCTRPCGAGGTTCCGVGSVCNPDTNTCCLPATQCNNNDQLCGDAEKICGQPCNNCPQNPDQVCNQGIDRCECRIKCGADGSVCCPDNQTCVNNTCCNPSCAGKVCGELNACGQKCLGCPSNETCNTTTNTCECPTTICNGVCCGAGSTCENNACCPTARSCPNSEMCCGASETCFQDPAGHDECCAPSRWCTDSKQCCSAAQPHCLNDGDQMADNDKCCGNSEFLCNGACCPNGNTCTQDGQCLSVCDPPCGCLQSCQGGVCVDIDCPTEKVCGCACCASGTECKPNGQCGPIG